MLYCKAIRIAAQTSRTLSNLEDSYISISILFPSDEDLWIMPEIGEGIHALSVFGINADVGNWKVARVVHYMRKHLVGKTLAKVVAQEDANVFGKVGTSADEIMKSLTGKKVVDAKQQGKYFW